MQAGRELDALVAEKVMGWNVEKDFAWDGESTGWWNDISHEHFNPSTDIAAAWEVMERLVAAGMVVIVKGDGLRSGDYNPHYTVLIGGQERTDADTAPLAICLAALKAVGATDAKPHPLTGKDNMVARCKADAGDSIIRTISALKAAGVKKQAAQGGLT